MPAAPAFATPGFTVELPYGSLRFADAMVGGPATYDGESILVYEVPLHYNFIKRGLSADTVIRLYDAEVSFGAVTRGELRTTVDEKAFSYYGFGDDATWEMPLYTEGYTLLEIEEKDIGAVTHMILHAVDGLPALPEDKCGENLTWSVAGGVLTICGTGAMYDYYMPGSGMSSATAPWLRDGETANAIETLVIENGVTYIGDYAFCGMWTLKTVKMADSYTGSIIHNYYLHEPDGQLSMIPWDYNLAFGTFQSNDATGTVNDPIDTPMSASDGSDRPMWGWIAQSEEYTALYHQYFADFLDSVDILGIIDEAYALIKDCVAKDPTAFCTYEEFETGVDALRSFCVKRIESVRGQLDGTIPSTTAGQNADDSALIDGSDITLSDMGRQGSAGGQGGGGGFPGGNRGGFGQSGDASSFLPPMGEGGSGQRPETDEGDPASGFPSMPSGDASGFTPPTGGDASSFLPPMGEGGSGQRPETDEGDSASGFPSVSSGDESSSSRPSGFSGGFPGGNGGSFPGGDFDPSSFGGASGGAGISAEQWITHGVCAAVLIAGLAVAIAWKRRA